MNRSLRLDLTDQLCYWFKPTVSDVAREFAQTLREGRIAGSRAPYVLGDQACVAFTEIPLALSAKLLSDAEKFGINYAPVGFLCQRRWLFEQGARPVIYQSEQEAQLLDPSQRYRHVTLDFERAIDFTWKREWRLPQSSLQLDARFCAPILPDRAWLEKARAAVEGSAAGSALVANTVTIDMFL